MMLFKTDFPAPPSTNELYVVRDGKRYKTKKYRAWLNSLPLQYQPQFVAKAPLRVEIFTNISRLRDIDNIAKPVLDGLQFWKIIPDDRYVDFIQIMRVNKEHQKIKGMVMDNWVVVTVELIE